jgi:hypothetical protein
VLAGTHDFVTDGEQSAAALAGALCEYGFPLVTAAPQTYGDGWEVSAADPGPYPDDREGYRWFDAVGRDAAAVARRYGGYPTGTSQPGPGDPPDMGRTAPIRREAPGARPPLPALILAPAPPSAVLADVPAPPAEPARLDGLDAVPWATLEHAFGSAADVPGLLADVAADPSRWPEISDELLGDKVLHQGTCYSATAPALGFLAALYPALNPPDRAELLGTLLFAASQWTGSVLGDADRAAAEHRPPEASPWTAEVRDAVLGAVPALLARWDAEPPAIRYRLAALAALCVPAGRQFAASIDELATEHEGTRQGEYLSLAAALLLDPESAPVIASGIASWDDTIELHWVDAPGVAPLLVARQVLAAGVAEV